MEKFGRDGFNPGDFYRPFFGSLNSPPSGRIFQSRWPLDARENWLTIYAGEDNNISDSNRRNAGTPGGSFGGHSVLREVGPGILQNKLGNGPKQDFMFATINQVLTQSTPNDLDFFTYVGIDGFSFVAPIYNRRHTLKNVRSFTNPSGMQNFDTGSGTHITFLGEGPADRDWETKLKPSMPT